VSSLIAARAPVHSLGKTRTSPNETLVSLVVNQGEGHSYKSTQGATVVGSEGEQKRKKESKKGTQKNGNAPERDQSKIIKRPRHKEKYAIRKSELHDKRIFRER